MYDIINPDLSVLGDAKVEVIYHSSDKAQQDSNLLGMKWQSFNIWWLQTTG